MALVLLVSQGQIIWQAWFLTTEFNFIAGPVHSPARCGFAFKVLYGESVFQVILPALSQTFISNAIKNYDYLQAGITL